MATNEKRETERREFIRKKTTEVNTYKYSKLTEREKYAKEQKRKEKKEVKKAMEEGQWITIQHQQPTVLQDLQDDLPIIKIERFNWAEDD